MQQDQNVKATRLALRHYLAQLKKDWPVAVPALLAPGIGTILMTYAPPLVVARLLVRFNSQHSLSLGQIWPYLLLFGGLWALGELVWRIGFQFLSIVDSRGIKRLYNQALQFLLAKDLGFFHDNFAGSLTKKTLAYSKNYEPFVDTLALNVSSNLLPLFFVVVILWRFSPWLVLALVGLTSLTALIITPLIRRRQKLVAEREAASEIAAGHVADVISNIDTVKSFAGEKPELIIHSRNVGNFVSRAKRTWDYHNLKIDGATSPFYVLTNMVGLAIALLFAHGSTTNLAVIFISFSYYASFTRVVWEFNHTYRNLENSITEAARFCELLLEEPVVEDIASPDALKIHRGEIEFKDVVFRYHDNSGDHLFSGLNLKIAPGEKVALVGHSGGGKTTVTRLLLRFMDLDSGQILIDDQNIAKVSQKDLRSAIAYVPQEPAMFHRSLSDNIRYGKLDADDKAVVRIAKMAHAHEFIKDLPKGYETLVGERGVKLSGGQRQRIAIARAMLKNAPILVLDEATSALDSESEKLIQAALWKLMEGRTAIVIAHRLSTIQRMDRIVVLEEGQIVEQGTHKELLSSGGIYANLWAHQSGGFLED